MTYIEYCNTNYIELPELSSSLKELYCYDNPLLKELPKLPPSLLKLDCNRIPLLNS